MFCGNRWSGLDYLVRRRSGVASIGICQEKVMAATESRVRVMGVSVAAGVAYLSIVDAPDELVLNLTPKIEPPAYEPDDWNQLRIFGARMVEEAKAVGATVVVFAETRKASQWVYSQAHSRASLIVTAGLALHHARIEARIISQRSAANFLDVEFGEALGAELAAKRGIRPRDVVYWKERAPGAAVALYYARDNH
jgi:hypothetical protein